MKILLVGNYISDSVSMRLFGDMLEAALKKAGYDVFLIRPEPLFGRLKLSNRGIWKWLGYVDKFILFPPRLKKAIFKADVVHICDHSNAVYIKYCRDVPHIVTCHDLLAIRSAMGEIKEKPTRWAGRRLQKIILNGLKKASYIVCVSDATKDDVLRLVTSDTANVSVIYPGLNYPYSPVDKERAGTILETRGILWKTPFFLHVGTGAWYKNRLGLLKIFRFIMTLNKKQQYNLVFAGAKLTDEMRQFSKKNGFEKMVYGIPDVTAEELQALYSTATALLFPSTYEGFGWPIIEAQACGCLVFTTESAPMTEVGGDAAIYIDPTKPEEAARVIVGVLNNDEVIASIRERGFLNIKRFTTEAMIEKYIRIYKELCR